MEQPRLEPPSPQELASLADRCGVSLTPSQVQLSLAYMAELARWNATTSLVQAPSWQELVRRHLAEGWVASRLLPEPGAPDEPLEALDIGSGGGIPALPLHVLRPDVRLTLVEPRERKAAFLQAVARHHESPQPIVQCRRLEDLEPEPLRQVVMFRGIKLDPALVATHLAPGGLVLRFPGNPDEVESSWLAAGFRPVARLPLPTAPLVVQAWQRA